MSEPVGSCCLAAVLLLLAADVFAVSAALPAVSETKLHERDDAASRRILRLLNAQESGRSELRRTFVLLLLGSLSAAEYAMLLHTTLPVVLAALLVFAAFSLAGIALAVVLPGSLAAQKPEKALHICAPLAQLCVTVLKPLNVCAWVLGRVLCMPLRLPETLSAEKVTEEEILQMVDLGEETGAIEENEKQMIENVFEFNNITASDCMVHRKDIRAIDIEDTDDEILRLIKQSGLSRFPVYEDTVDNVIGVLTTRDYLLNRCAEHPRAVRLLLRKPHFVPESVRADVLFKQMQQGKQHLAIVVDEYGGTGGIVTMEDLLEEIVGNIYDEFDPNEEQECTKLADGRYLVAGAMPLEAFGEVIGREIDPGEDCETVGGLVFSRMTEIPADGTHPVVECCGLRISVTKIADRRVEWAVVDVLHGEFADDAEDSPEDIE